MYILNCSYKDNINYTNVIFINEKENIARDMIKSFLIIKQKIKYKFYRKIRKLIQS